MLKFLRKKENQKRIYLILAVVIIPPFVLWGVFLQKNEKGPSTLGVIEGKKISLQDYLKSYQAVEHQAALVYGEKLAQLRPFINFKGEAWDRLLLLDYAKKEGIRTSDDEVVSWLTRQPAFTGKKGDFDADFYKLYVGQFLRTSTRAFEEEIRQFLTMHKIRKRFESTIEIGDAELKALYLQANGARDITYALVPWEPGKKATQAAVQKLDGLKAKMSASGFEKALQDEGIEIKTMEKFSPGSEVPGIGRSKRLEKEIARLKEGETSPAFPVPSGPVRNAVSNGAGAAIVKVLKDWPIDEAKFNQEKESFRERTRKEKADEAFEKLLDGLRKKLEINLETFQNIFPEGQERKSAPA